MRTRPTLAVMSVALLMTGCSTPERTGLSRVRLETYPVDGTCELTGRNYTAEADTPANVEYPAAAAPIIVDCRRYGYEGKAVLDNRTSPWSPANVGSLGLGSLLDGSEDTPPTFRVTMEYTDASTREDAKAIDAEKTPVEPDKPKGEEDKKTAPAPAEMKAKTSAPTGRIRVHLASFKERSRADRAWKAMTGKTGKLLSGLSPEVEQIDLGAKGRFFRVYAGGLKNMKAARDLCVDLKKRKVYCRPVAKGAN